MKVKNVILSASGAIALLIMLVSIEAYAQRGPRYEQRMERFSEGQIERPGFGPGFCRNLPGITSEQIEKIDALRLKNMKENQQLRNELGEKRARMRTLSSADNPDMKAIEKLIDEMSAIRAKMHKNMARTHQEIRNVLTEEQRVMFDNRGPGMRGGDFRAEARPGRRGPGFRNDCPYRK